MAGPGNQKPRDTQKPQVPGESLTDLIRRYSSPGSIPSPDWVNAEKERGAATKRGAVDRADGSIESCGDRVSVFRHHDGRIWIEAVGCAICKASAALANRAAGEGGQLSLIALVPRVVATLDGASQGPETPTNTVPDDDGTERAPWSEDLATLVRVSELPGRRGCAALPWRVLATLLEEGSPGSSR